jgi:hypothetical protein
VQLLEIQEFCEWFEYRRIPEILTTMITAGWKARSVSVSVLRINVLDDQKDATDRFGAEDTDIRFHWSQGCWV